MGWFSNKDDDRSEELQQHHNDGQRDGSNVEYNEPHPYNPLYEFFISDDEIREREEDNDAYDKGNKNGFNQI